MVDGTRIREFTCFICGEQLKLTNLHMRAYWVPPGWANTNTHLIAHAKRDGTVLKSEENKSIPAGALTRAQRRKAMRFR